MPLRGLLAIVTFTGKPRFSRTEAAFVFCGPTTWNKLPCVQPDFLYMANLLNQLLKRSTVSKLLKLSNGQHGEIRIT